MAKHSPRFLKLVEDVKGRVVEVSITEIHARLQRGDSFCLIDVREESEWSHGHLPQAEHLGKGIIERDIETRIPDTSAEIVLYCGGGYRSALAADALRQMGYVNVLSMAGGFRGWREAELPVE